jgi:hypothetical protein
MAELWKKIRIAESGYEKTNFFMQDLKESVANYRDDMFTFNDQLAEALESVKEMTSKLQSEFDKKSDAITRENERIMQSHMNIKSEQDKILIQNAYNRGDIVGLTAKVETVMTMLKDYNQNIRLDYTKKILHT